MLLYYNDESILTLSSTMNTHISSMHADTRGVLVDVLLKVKKVIALNLCRLLALARFSAALRMLACCYVILFIGYHP